MNNNKFNEGDYVDGVIYRISNLGYNVKLDEFTVGLLYKAETFQNLKTGDKVKVYIKKIREDGKIDLAISKGGYKNFIDDSTRNILDMLEESGGSLPFNDRSSPDAIQRNFQMSKKKFKEAIGALYKQRVIEITDDGIKLIKQA